MKISLAEMEYSLEKDQIEMMNLSQKIQTARMENVKISALKEISKQETLYRNVENSKSTALLYGHTLDRSQLDLIKIRYEGFGLEVREDSDDDKIHAGDRVIEVNGEDVLRMLPGQWQTLSETLVPPVKVVVLRMIDTVSGGQEAGAGGQEFRFDVTHVNGLKDDIAMIQTRLSEKLREGRTVTLELASVQSQRDKLAGDNTRLQHRIQYLEEQVAHLESGMKQVSAECNGWIILNWGWIILFKCRQITHDKARSDWGWGQNNLLRTSHFNIQADLRFLITAFIDPNIFHLSHVRVLSYSFNLFVVSARMSANGCLHLSWNIFALIV